MCKTPVVFATRAIFVTLKVLLIVGALCFTVACMSGGSAGSSAASQDEHHALFKEWQVIDTTTGQPIPLDQWTALLVQQDIIYLGEEHHNRFHIDAALTVLRRLREQNAPLLRRVILMTGSGPAITNAWSGLVFAVVHKPFDSSTLVNIVRECVRQPDRLVA